MVKYRLTIIIDTGQMSGKLYESKDEALRDYECACRQPMVRFAGLYTGHEPVREYSRKDDNP